MTTKPTPLIRSVGALRVLAAGVTLLGLGGMTAYAGGHLHNAAAPLAPVAAPARPAPAATGRLTLGGRVATTTARPVTKTRQS